MEDREPEPAPAPARARKPKKKSKKEVPVGRNGLKKRRVVKSRMTTDDKGYFGTSHLSPLYTSPRALCEHVRLLSRSDGGLLVVRIRGRRGTTPRETCKGKGEEDCYACRGEGRRRNK